MLCMQQPALTAAWDSLLRDATPLDVLQRSAVEWSGRRVCTRAPVNACSGPAKQCRGTTEVTALGACSNSYL